MLLGFAVSIMLTVSCFSLSFPSIMPLSYSDDF
jgi:hypothetical protein